MNRIENLKITSDIVERNSLFLNEDIALFNDQPNINLPEIAKTEFYLIALVVEGKVSFYNNGHWFVVKPNDLIVCIPQDIVQNILLSVDCKLCCIGISPAYMQRVLPIANSPWNLLSFFSKQTFCTLSPEETVVFCQYYDLLCSKLRHQSVIQENVLNALMLAWFFDVQEILNRYVQTDKKASYTAGEVLFNKFIELLKADFPKQRNVSYYADKLCISPKYISAVCKRMSGQTASALIDQYVVKDVEYLLKFSSKSIKEVSVELDFPSLCAFGKYVRKHFGASPREVRQRFKAQGGRSDPEKSMPLPFPESATLTS